MVFLRVRISSRPPGNMSSCSSGSGGSSGAGPHAQHRVDIRRFDRAAFLQPLVERHKCRMGLPAGFDGAIDCKFVSPPADFDPKALFQLRKVAVVLTAQVDQQAIVRELDNILGRGRVQISLPQGNCWHEMLSPW